MTVDLGDQMKIPTKTCVAIIGGGPAGSLSAILLAREGIDVCLFEKDKFPRYHVGESMLPLDNELLDFAGVKERIDSHRFAHKAGSYFRFKPGTPAGAIDFSKRNKRSYNIIRSEFDQLLLEYAREMGAKVFEETSIKSVDWDNDQPTKIHWETSFQESSTKFDYLIDASGQSGILGSRYLKNRQLQDSLTNVGLGMYWRGYRPFVNDQGIECKDYVYTETLADGTGWIWAIPLHDQTLSVGIVLNRDDYKSARQAHGSNEAIYQYQIQSSPDLAAMLAEAIPVSETVKVWKDASYLLDSSAGPNYRIAGDAAGFIDPLLSSGIHMAFLGALSASATICASLKKECSEEEAFTYHNKCIRQAYARFSIIVVGTYNQLGSKENVVLRGLKSEDIQLAFAFIQQFLSEETSLENETLKNLDLNQSEVPKDVLQNMTQFGRDLVLELHGIQTENRVARLITEKGHDKGNIFHPTNAIDRKYVRLQRGNLGLEKISMWSDLTNRIKTQVAQSALSLVAHGKK